MEELVRELVGTRPFAVSENSTWRFVRADGQRMPEHGWKLHISCRAVELPEVARRVLPVLLDAGCTFKLARSVDVLTELNDGIRMPATVGKAFTVYPDQRQVRVLGFRLAELLRGVRGPRVLSDRRIDEGAPVYYRYGPFSNGWRADGRGELRSAILGPDGSDFEAPATLRYRQPSWAVDPFTGSAAEEDEDDAEQPVLAGRYRLTEGIRQAATGNVFRALDERTGESVVVKQARALVQERPGQNDTRLRLRNERRVLSVLDGVTGVPRFLDHFGYGDDEFLVISDAGVRNLGEDLAEHGRYLPRDTNESDPKQSDPNDGDANAGDLDQLARRLATVLVRTHRHGVVMGDLSPKNVVLGSDHVPATASIVDFGNSSYQDVHIWGVTKGYAPSWRHQREAPSEADDFHALGMTLWYAATGMHPVEPAEDDHDLPRRRTLAQIRWTYGAQPPPVIRDIALLVSGDKERVVAAGRRLGSAAAPEGDPGAPGDLGGAIDHLPVVDDDLVARSLERVLADQLLAVDDLLHGDRGRPVAHDACLYSGSAGVGLELLQHRDQPGVAERIEALIRFSVRAADEVELPPGLFVGRTGVDLFLAEARAAGFAAPDARLPPSGWEPEGEDLVIGSSGVALGHLLIHRRTGEQAHLEVALDCARRLVRADAPGSAYDDALVEGRKQIGIDVTLGRAHGAAGPVAVLTELAARSAADGDTLADPCWIGLAAERAAELAERTEPLLSLVGSPRAMPLSASWCQGLTGIATTLARAGLVLRNPGLIALAERACAAVSTKVPLMSTLGQCCGVLGVGQLHVELAMVTGDNDYLERARQVIIQLLLRSRGPLSADTFGTGGVGGPGAYLSSWAQGLTGLLGFLRRLHHGGGPLVW